MSFNYVYVCVSLYGYVWMNECRCPRRLEASDAWELEFKVVVSCLTRVLGTEPWTSFKN